MDADDARADRPALERAGRRGRGAGGRVRELAYTEVASGVPYTQRTNVMVPPSSASSTFPLHPDYADFVQSEANVSFSTPSGSLSIIASAERSAPGATSQTAAFDLSTVPLITSTSLDEVDAGTPEQPSVSWTSTAPLSGSNGLIVLTQWYGTTDAGEVKGGWTIVSSPDGHERAIARAPSDRLFLGPRRRRDVLAASDRRRDSVDRAARLPRVSLAVRELPSHPHVDGLFG